MNTSLNRGLAQLTRKKPSQPPPKAPVGGADPLAALGISRDRAGGVAELHFSGLKLNTLHPNLMLFTGLQTLWLNRNDLTELRGLVPSEDWKNESGVRKLAAPEQRMGTHRLLHLYLSDNKIASLAGDIVRLKYLETLLLANNKLTNMEVVVARLTALPSLRTLDLFGNPLAEEHNYRLYVIYRLPNLQIFDRHEVSAAERDAARRLFAKEGSSAAKASFGRSPDAHDPHLDGTPGADMPLSLSTGHARHAHDVVFAGRRWRRIWHQVDGARGALDIRPTIVAQLAQRATRVHIRNAGDVTRSVTTIPEAWPLLRLRQARCLSCMPDGNIPTPADIRAVWQGHETLLARLHGDAAAADRASADRPLTRVLYETVGNTEGLHLISGAGEGQCGWGKGTPSAIEVYLDCGNAEAEGDAGVKESQGVRQLEAQVRVIKGTRRAENWRERSAAGQASAEAAQVKKAFHVEWDRRREARLEQELAEVNARRVEAKQAELSLADYKDSLAVKLDDAREEREKGRGAVVESRKKFLPSHKLKLAHQPLAPDASELLELVEKSEILRTLPQRLCGAGPGDTLSSDIAKALEDAGLQGDLCAVLAAASRLAEDGDVARIKSSLRSGAPAAGAVSDGTTEVAVDVLTGGKKLDTAAFSVAVAKGLELAPQRVRVTHIEREEDRVCVSLRLPRVQAEELLQRIRTPLQDAVSDPLRAPGSLTEAIEGARVVPQGQVLPS
eukprot:Hpha_TRINITY_DN15390_c0_g1::TRINITY_DN15390_c0_g1_i1::g.92050::m.92050